MVSEFPPRPDHLPDFEQPPLNEVVLGVQFAPPQGYQQIRAGEVWNLYRSDFPIVEEHQAIPPAFEILGVPPQKLTVNFGLISGGQHDRFWFLAPSKDELIQFQNDRLLHNWRKVASGENPYPRFEKIIASFDKELHLLEGYFNGLVPQKLACNQAEISYINHIPIDRDQQRGKAGEWLRLVDFGDAEPDDLSMVFRRTISGDNGAPYARLICELTTASKPQCGRIFVLTLTVRGAPSEPSIASALALLSRGRDVIVQEFTSITTDSAHEIWGRVK
jgi:uncharacterized protein (TIGR04255 family)